MPVLYAKITAALFFAVITIFIWRLPTDYISATGEKPKLNKDIRFWSTLLLLAQLVLYYIF